MTARTPNLAVLIDADNASARHASAIFEEVARLGEANVRRIYGDFSTGRLKGWDAATRALAILEQQSRCNTTGKNASDIALVIDAMDLMHTAKLDGVCLVSSDSDFTRLAQRLREHGLVVYGFGERKTPETFRAACNRFIYVENLAEGAEVAPAADVAQALDAAPPAAPEAPPEPPRRDPPSRAVPVLVKAMLGAEDEDGWVALSAVGHRAQAIAPDFDTRSFGCAKLSDLARKSGAFELKGSGSSLMMRLTPLVRPKK